MSKLDSSFCFHDWLLYFYRSNRNKIRSHYNELTKKFLAYNDKTYNPEAFLREPQFEALEIYVFLKEVFQNKSVREIFNQWCKHEGIFSDSSYYSGRNTKQEELFKSPTEEQTKKIFTLMSEYQEDYANYIFALTMGLGKTILMATCIFYEFLLARKYPKSNKYCHNALVFAPDKTVLQSLKEIITFDKTKVIPREYARVLDSNIKFHFLDESGKTLSTIDDSDFNLIISNTQKIIVKKKHKEAATADKLFQSDLLNVVLGDDQESADLNESNLTENERFEKLTRLPRLGIYVDEAHHLFGSDLIKQLRSKKGDKTRLRYTINRLHEKTPIVACFNFTGTPYVQNQLLPEVVYSYGLRESILKGYLKNANPCGYENVKDTDFLSEAIDIFWKKYAGQTYEGLTPKMAIYATSIREAIETVRPAVEKKLKNLGVPLSSILLNVGDPKYTKDEDIQNFNNLDVIGSIGNKKQFIILVEKGKEGWNCRSLFAVAMFRTPSSKVFVLQATMRCLRAITKEQQTASIFLSKENFDILNQQLIENFNVDMEAIKNSTYNETKKIFKVRVLPPERKIRVKNVRYVYSVTEKPYSAPINFGLINFDYRKYQSTVYEKMGLAYDMAPKEKVIDIQQEKIYFTLYTLTFEIARYLNVSCVLISKILNESTDGVSKILEAVNKFNPIVYDVIIPLIFKSLFEIKRNITPEEKEIILLKKPADKDYYEFSAKPSLVVSRNFSNLKEAQKKKSFHADTYCFDSKPEKECFMQYITSDKVEEIYFTGMFTNNQGELKIPYYDPESGRIRQYYPDFLAKLKNGLYQLIEVKAANLIDDVLVQAKAEAAKELASESGFEYLILSDEKIKNENII